ncbi:hypothetical protein VNO77_41788 [Canavalia gladiata]|uniref:Uncharacterized protein n=1 Tax=Canavalia gladiata TaxID=3824 RepID=A0AAN9K1H8_CANGL
MSLILLSDMELCCKLIANTPFKVGNAFKYLFTHAYDPRHAEFTVSALFTYAIKQLYLYAFIRQYMDMLTRPLNQPLSSAENRNSLSHIISMKISLDFYGKIGLPFG